MVGNKNFPLTRRRPQMRLQPIYVNGIPILVFDITMRQWYKYVCCISTYLARVRIRFDQFAGATDNNGSECVYYNNIICYYIIYIYIHIGTRRRTHVYSVGQNTNSLLLFIIYAAI